MINPSESSHQNGHMNNKGLSYAHGASSRPLQSLTVGGLVDSAAANFPTREAVVFKQQFVRKTFLEVKQDVDRLAAGLLDLGLQKGDRIGIWGPNLYEWYLTQFAAAKAGLILANINPAYRPSELKFCLNKVGISAIVCMDTFKTQDYLAMLTEVVGPELGAKIPGELQSKEVPTLRHVIIISQKTYKGCHKFSDISRGGSIESMQRILELSEEIQTGDAWNIQFTSGTTGKPKGVCLTHHGTLNNCLTIGYRIGYDKKIHRTCCPVPLYHCFGSVLGTLTMMYHGGACIFPATSYNAKEALKTVQEEKCTSLYGTPTMFIDMLRVLTEERSLDVSSLETGVMTGAPCPRELCRAVAAKMNMKHFTVLYGSTETSPVSFQTFPTDSLLLRTTTIGCPLDHIEAKIIDQNGRTVPFDTPGQLCVRGYHVMLGYWNDEEKTREVISKDRWYHSGDLAVMHENGYCQIVGRMKDMVIRGGENIYPREIEELLHTHPNIAEAQVAGVPDERMGEELCAWIRIKDVKKGELTPDSIKDYCKGKIAHFKIPRYIHFTDEFPTTVTGKVQKFRITEQSIKIFNLQNINQGVNPA